MHRWDTGPTVGGGTGERRNLMPLWWGTERGVKHWEGQKNTGGQAREEKQLPATNQEKKKLTSEL